LPELDIARTHRGRRGARSTEHFLGHVDAHDAAFRPDLNSRLPLAMPVVFEFGSGARKTERGPLVMPSHVGRSCQGEEVRFAPDSPLDSKTSEAW
jgi:hypothetical protein